MNFFFSSRRRHTFFFQAEDGIRDRSPSRGLGDVYKRQVIPLIEAPVSRVNARSTYFNVVFNSFDMKELSLYESGVKYWWIRPCLGGPKNNKNAESENFLRSELLRRIGCIKWAPRRIRNFLAPIYYPMSLLEPSEANSLGYFRGTWWILQRYLKSLGR